jgi:hypothetical protein
MQLQSSDLGPAVFGYPQKSEESASTRDLSREDLVKLMVDDELTLNGLLPLRLYDARLTGKNDFERNTEVIEETQIDFNLLARSKKS